MSSLYLGQVDDEHQVIARTISAADKGAADGVFGLANKNVPAHPFYEDREQRLMPSFPVARDA